jgi:predicted phage tail protein
MGAPADADDMTARALDAAAEQEAEDMTPEQQAMLNSARADAAAARGAAEKAYNAANRSASGVAQIIPAVAKLAADQAADAALTRQILDRLAQTTPGGAALPIDYGQVQAASERAVRAVLGELDQTPTPGGIQR